MDFRNQSRGLFDKHYHKGPLARSRSPWNRKRWPLVSNKQGKQQVITKILKILEICASCQGLVFEEMKFINVTKHFKPESTIGPGYNHKAFLLSKGNFCVPVISVLLRVTNVNNCVDSRRVILATTLPHNHEHTREITLKMCYVESFSYKPLSLRLLLVLITFYASSCNLLRFSLTALLTMKGGTSYNRTYIKWSVVESRIYFLLITAIWTFVKRSPLFSDRGHLWAIPNGLILYYRAEKLK